MRTFFSLLALVVVALVASSCSATCDFPIRCLDHCGGTEVMQSRCGTCPSGSVPFSSCVDASVSDAATHDAAADAR